MTGELEISTPVALVGCSPAIAVLLEIWPVAFRESTPAMALSARKSATIHWLISARADTYSGSSGVAFRILSTIPVATCVALAAIIRMSPGSRLALISEPGVFSSNAGMK